MLDKTENLDIIEVVERLTYDERLKYINEKQDLNLLDKMLKILI